MAVVSEHDDRDVFDKTPYNLQLLLATPQFMFTGVSELLPALALLHGCVS